MEVLYLLDGYYSTATAFRDVSGVHCGKYIGYNSFCRLLKNCLYSAGFHAALKCARLARKCLLKSGFRRAGWTDRTILSVPFSLATCQFSVRLRQDIPRNA